MAESQGASEPESGRSSSSGSEVTRTVRIKNPAGLHARPCHAIVSKALAHESELWVTCAGREVNGKSILELMTLCAPCEAELSFRAKGKDATKLVAELEALVNAGFDEMEG